MSIKPSDFLYALRNETIRVIEELKPVLDKANSLYEHLDRIAEDCEDAAELAASSDIEPNTIATVPERSGLTRCQCSTIQTLEDPPSGYMPATEEVHEDFTYQWGGNEQGSQSQLETLKRLHDSEMRKAEKQAWDAKEQAWDEGFNAGWAEAKDSGPFDEAWDAKRPNPYRRNS